MRVDLDRSTGSLRLDDEGFEALVAGTDATQEVRADPAVAAALRAVDTAEVRVCVDVAGRGLTQTHLAWVTPEAVALLLSVTGHERQLITTAPQHLAAAVARVVRIGPRKVGERTAVEVDQDVLEDLFHADETRRWSAMTVAGADLAWTLSATWDDGERLLSVVDGPSGLQAVEPDGEGRWRLVPVTGTWVWRRLTTLLPD